MMLPLLSFGFAAALIRIGVGHDDTPMGWDAKNSMLTWYQRFNSHQGAECGFSPLCRCLFDKDITREVRNVLTLANSLRV